MALDIITLVVLVLQFISWLVFMAGTAAWTAEKNVAAYEVGYIWWAVWFQFFVLIFVGLSACMGSENMNRLRTYLLLMVSVVLMESANTARVAVNTTAGDVKTDAQATLAGAILLLIFNFVYVLYWGLTNHGMNGVNLRKGPAPEAPANTTAEPTKTVEAVPV